ncbi:M48 family metallopeptidase [Bacteroidales bacterium OttesenSCG-928-I21]|nr:M48 family metallopeptidase [Bacteroidales bacterium OttesenSCG-928-I21]
MTSQLLFLIILAIVVIGFFFEQILDFLNAMWFNKPIPKALSDVYDNKKYKIQQEYKFENYRFGIITSSFSFIIIVLMLLFQGFAFVDMLASKLSDYYILKALFFFLIIFLASDILNIPFDVYDTFVIEKKYGFNKTTIKTYIFDKIKSWTISLIIGGGLLSAIIYLYSLNPHYFWLFAWLLIIVFSIFMNMVYSSLIVPLFNKQTPLEDGELRTAIINFGEKAGFCISNIFVIDGSKRSTKANAYFSGIGSKKRIVLYDTLIEEMRIDEIVSVLAHEIGHYKHKHIYKNLIFSIFETGFMLYIFGLFASSDILSQSLGVEAANFHIALIAFGIIYSPISTILGIFSNIQSRKAEYQADNFAKNYGLEKSLVSALKKLSSHNMSNLTPHPLVVFVEYSHPPVNSRITNLIS